MTRDRSWFTADRTSDAWKIGVSEFVEESYRLVGTDGKIYCPCGRCDNQERLNSEEVKRHIIWWGVNQPYFMGDWYLHGEELSAKKSKHSRDCSIPYVVVDEEVLQEVNDLTGRLGDASQMLIPPRGSEAAKFYERVKEAGRPLYQKNFFYKKPDCDWSDPKNCHPNVPHPQRPFLVDQWSDPHYQEIDEIFLDNRVDHPHPNHHMGSKGYPALATQMISVAELENCALPDDFDIWVKGVTNKKGEVDEASQKAINRFNEKVIEFTNEDESASECQHPTSTPRKRAWDFVNDEKNSAKHGHRLGKGSGPTISMLSGGRKIQKFVNEEMITKLTTTQHELEMTKEDLATTRLKANEDKIARMQAFLETKFGYIDGS